MPRRFPKASVAVPEAARIFRDLIFSRGAQLLADAAQVDEPVDLAQQVIHRDVSLHAARIEERLLRHRPLTHSSTRLPLPPRSESEESHRRKDEFFNSIGQKAAIQRGANGRFHPLRTRQSLRR